MTSSGGKVSPVSYIPFVYCDEALIVDLKLLVLFQLVSSKNIVEDAIAGYLFFSLFHTLFSVDLLPPILFFFLYPRFRR